MICLPRCRTALSSDIMKQPTSLFRTTASLSMIVSRYLSLRILQKIRKSVVVSFVVLIFSGYLFSYVLLAMPDTNTCGYSIRTSLSDASDLVNKNPWQTILLIALPFVVVLPLQVLGVVFNFQTISAIVGMIIIFMYYPILSYTLYFDYSRLERYDNVKHRYYK